MRSVSIVDCEMQIADYKSKNSKPGIRNLKSNGFTLIEIIMTIVIVSILAGIAAVIILQGVKAYTTEQPRSNVHYQTKLAVERMAREVRQIRSCTTGAGGDITTTTANTLQFNDINGNTVNFSVAGGVLTRNANTLATGIISAQTFSYLTSAGMPSTACPGLWFIDITITDQQGTNTIQMSTRVHPMNF